MLDQLKNTVLALNANKGLREQHPNEPWLWRQDWAARAVRDNAGFAYTGCAWAFGCLWMAICVPITIVFIATSRADDPKLWFVLLFPIVGLAILGMATYLTMRRRKFGESVCHIERVPIAIGRTFRGHIESKLAEIPESGFQLRLVCARRVTRHSGSKRHTTETVLWEHGTTVPRAAVTRTATGVRVPFSFAVPPHSEPVNDTNRDDQVLWRLVARADVPGIDYGTSFDLPVFETGEAPEVHTSTFTAVPQPLPDSGVTVENDEIVVEGQRRIGQVLGGMVFSAFWFVLIAYMGRMQLPRWFVGVFLAAGLIAVLATLDFALGRTSIRATRTEVKVRRSWLGLGYTVTHDAAEIETVDVDLGKVAGNRSYYDVYARLRGGRTVKIAKNIAEKVNAESVAGRMRRQLGR